MGNGNISMLSQSDEDEIRKIGPLAFFQNRFSQPSKGDIQNVLRKLPTNPQDRKGAPVTTGVLDYFPLAIAEVARISEAGNRQHNPGQPLHWARGKSVDHADCVTRHLIERGTIDSDGQRHTAKMAWRALALLQEELEAEAGFVPEPPTKAVSLNVPVLTPYAPITVKDSSK